jgi:putative transposase
VDCALASIARGRSVRSVCSALRIARSHVIGMMQRSANWVDQRKAEHKQLDDPLLIEQIKAVVNIQGSYGYRRVWAVLKHQQAICVNHKRIYRMMRDAGMLLYRHGYPRATERRHDGVIQVKESNQRWCSDGLEIRCDNGDKVRVAFALDCCDREILSWVATTRGITGHLINDLMMQAMEKRFGMDHHPDQPIERLTDNGSCYIAHETKAFARMIGLKPVTTPVSSPQSNGMAESFVKTLKRDYAALADKPDAVTVMQKLDDWFEHYNTKHPHSALNYLSPRMFRQKQMEALST